MADTSKKSDRSPRGEAGGHRSLLRSKWLYAGLGVAILGGLWWGYAVLAADTPAGGGRLPAGVAGLQRGDGPVAKAADPGLGERYAPTVLAVGVSFVVAYFLGYLLRALLRVAVIMAAVVVIAVIALRATGVWEGDVSGVERQAEEALAQAKSLGVRARESLMDVLPSGVAGVLGLFVGARRG
jgi:uncharacterized membrane protein (Fun14 family)